jgi:P27 family predicted phage terminase small subunit
MLASAVGRHAPKKSSTQRSHLNLKSKTFPVILLESRSVLMSNPPVPLRLKLLRGNPGRRALRAEPEPTIPSEPPEPPSFLLPAAKDEWHRVAGELHALGLLTVLDVNLLAAYCESFGRWQQAETMLAEMADRNPDTGALTVKTAAGNRMFNPLLQIARNAAADMLKFASEFGLSPVARTRISSGIVGTATGGKFDGLLG